jgi:glycosyltransferase involved in cell wall biosynthesis
MSGDRRRPRILFINHWAKSLGGAEYSLIDLLRALPDQVDACLITSEPGLLLESVKKMRVRRLVVPCSAGILSVKRDHLVQLLVLHWRSVIGFFRYVLRVHSAVHRLKPDCIHANIPKSHITLFFCILIGYRGAGVIHMRELFTPGTIAYFCYYLIGRFCRVKVIAISEAVRKGLPDALRQKTRVIYNGVRIPDRRERRQTTLPIRFLYLGRVVPWKGCHSLIEAFSDLLTKVPPGSATLRLVGATSYWNSSYRDELKALIKRSKLDQVVVLENTTDDPCRVLAQHDVLCMPSSNEPFGRVAAEAQGCGLPVIGYAGGGLPEIIVHEETGLLVPADNTKAFADAMTEFVEYPERIILWGENGYRRAVGCFNREYQVPLIMACLLEEYSSPV